MAGLPGSNSAKQVSTQPHTEGVYSLEERKEQKERTENARHFREIIRLARHSK
jgi:hypothetical protein